MDRIDRAGISRWAVVLLAGAAALLPWLVGRKSRPTDEQAPPPELNRPSVRLSAALVPGANRPPLFEAQSPIRPLRAGRPSARNVRAVGFPAPLEAEAVSEPAGLPESAGPSLVAPSLEPSGPIDPQGSRPGQSEIFFRAAKPGPSPEVRPPTRQSPRCQPPAPVAQPPVEARPSLPDGQPFLAPEAQPPGKNIELPPSLEAEPTAPGSGTALSPDPPRPIAPWTATPLAPQAPAERSEQLEQIARQADQLTRHGYELANLKAYFAARAEFLAALRLLAQGLDAECQTDVHGRALAAALTALREADDFALDDRSAHGELDVPTLAARHATPVLKAVEGRGLSPLVALRQYLTYAQEQLALAAGREVAGSMALHALGKLHGAMAAEKYDEVKLAEAKAVAYYQAALLTFPTNAMAANDLGVLLARGGMVEQARSLLERSVLLAPTSTAWRNLAVVYQQAGRPELAQAAARQAESLRRAEAARGADVAAGGPSVRWVDATWLARLGGDPTNIPAVRQPAPPAAAPVPTSPPARAASASHATVAAGPRLPNGTAAGRAGGTGRPAVARSPVGAPSVVAPVRGGDIVARNGSTPAQTPRGSLGAWWHPEFYAGGARQSPADSASAGPVEATSSQRAAGRTVTQRN